MLSPEKLHFMDLRFASCFAAPVAFFMACRDIGAFFYRLPSLSAAARATRFARRP
ncbi:hypothetical protein H3O04_34995, partial [Burkholderia sp. KCJ3K979]|nr:hypothetical protein [Burkholderia sp. KCJ3K979]